jgi:hypothetical protein
MTDTQPEDTITRRCLALAKHLGADPEDISESIQGDFTFDDDDGGEWLVLTDEEANDRAAAYIEESLWAFDADFLSDFTPEGIGAGEIRAIRGDRCEDANGALLALVKVGRGMKALVEDAIDADGRGHFMGNYDGREHESEGYYLYRIN